MPKKKSEHYVNNKELLEALIVYKSKVEKDFYQRNDRKATKEDRAKHWEGKPQIPNYLGECFLKIATHLSYKPNFVNYMFRDDMISDGIETLLLEKKKFMESNDYVQYIKNQGITHIVLAGFLLKVPDSLIHTYNNKILNIHPALLPAYGGKGMYGEHVHQAVIQAGEKETGITIHLVDEEYDHGKTLFQAKVNVEPNDTPASLAEKVHRLEHEHYPAVIEKWVSRTS